jgi:hypothetical protein
LSECRRAPQAWDRKFRIVPFLLLLAVLAASACGRPSDAPGESGSRETTAVRSTAKELPEQGGPMPAGRYATERFEPAFAFEVGEGWGLILPEMPEAVGLGTAPDEGLTFHRPRGVAFDPNKPRVMEEVEVPSGADGWASWFAEHPHLDASEPEPVTVGGVSGVQVDIEPSSVPKDYSPECGDLAPCIPLYPFGEVDVMASYLGYRDRFVVLEVDGDVVIIDVAAPTDRFEGLARSAGEVLDSVEWEAGP